MNKIKFQSYVHLAFRIAILLAVIFSEFSCNTQDAVAGPGQIMSFWIEIKMNNKDALRYKIARIFAMDEDEKEKIGQCIGPYGHGGSEKFKVTLPESYVETKMTFAIDLEVKQSGFDNIGAFVAKIESLTDTAGTKITIPPEMFTFLDTFPIAKGLIKSRYARYTVEIPKAGDTVSVDISNTTNNALPGYTPLKIGNSPGSIQLSTIPGLPMIYTINVVTDAIDYMGFTLAAVLALPFNGSEGTGMPDFANPIGISAPELDWIFITIGDAAPGDAVALYFLFTAPEDGHACVCGPSCPIKGCMAASMPTIPPAYEALLPDNLKNYKDCMYTQFSNVIFFSFDTGLPYCLSVLPDYTGEQIDTTADPLVPDDFKLGSMPNPLPVGPATITPICGPVP
ncbi:hypothetical protein FACS1894102_1950 [Spirochaetia bacterium]|nr:hypothetical protein FACS1894102_1950 [Spirochaetia bacterium]